MTETEIRKVSILGRDSIHCGFNLIPYIIQKVLATLPSSTYVLITDTVVASYHLSKFQDEFSSQQGSKGASARFLTYVIEPGEGSKSRKGKAAIEDFLLERKCTRDTVILALGGGVIGDLVGFVAATFMRGVRFCQIPTTLLAMVDSSVGGKTAIDTPHGKNLIGAFWQPEYIFIDAAFLETLPPREFSNGMAEVIKTAAIWNEEEFNALESRSAEIFAAVQSRENADAAARALLLSVIAGSIGVKAHIVTVDERETGLRNLVNFGHTIGHAIEAVLTPAVLHGECVAVGMILEAEVARARGVLSQVAVGRISRCLKAYNLPTSISDPRIASLPQAKLLSVDRLLDIMAIDKKNSGAAKKVVLLKRIGKTLEERATVVPDDVIRKTLCEAARVVPGVPRNHPVKMATPGSKSISNRALLLAALAEGTCKLTNLLHSDDTQVMMNALIDLKGAKFSWEDGGETLVVEGGGGSLSSPPPGKEIYLGNAGTAARFLTTVCTLVQSMDKAPTVITGNARMKQRPVGPLVSALAENGCSIAFKESEGCLPLAIMPGGLPGGSIRLAASISSQYVSSILLCAPYAREPVVLELTGGQVISQPYIDMTIAMMQTFGINVERHRDPQTGALLNVYTIPCGKYRNPGAYAIESDASSATYPLAVAAITGTTCTVQNIGSASLQGDARFAKDVLEPMGCVVEQTETETSVTGPPKGRLRALGLIDMEPMTDAFLTASVLAAAAAGEPFEGRKLYDGSPMVTTRIVGIANQRVKECNRIKAMIDQLAKFGIETKELDDGLEVYGKPIEELKEGCSIHCYDDHRVAMAFSVLGTVIKDTIIEEKRCVEKTWPNWWDDLENKIGLSVEGVELSTSPVHGAPSLKASENPSASVVIIGMRGSGKTFIGGLAAQSLGWTFLDADHAFEEYFKTGVREFVHEHGWPTFRAAETSLLKILLGDHPTDHIISLGGGIVETPAARDVLIDYGKKKGPVVQIIREADEVVKYLTAERERPQYGEPIEDVCRRREPWFAQCSTYQFVNYTGTSGKSYSKKAGSKSLTGYRAEVSRFFKQVAGVKRNNSTYLGKRSYFLSLTYPDVTVALPNLDELTAGADAIELRVDLLRSPKDKDTRGNYVPPTAYVVEQLTALRQRTSLPIVFTVRSGSQGGSHPDSAENEAFALFDVAARMGCEYIDVELSWNEARIREFAQRKGNAQIIASWHDWSGNMKWDGPQVKEKYAKAVELGDIVKIVGKANTLEDNFTLRAFDDSANAKPGAKPFIAINTGYEGQLSRILNSTLSPITHPLMSVSAAPGQLSFAQIQTALHLIGQLPARRYYLLGTPISTSPSPTLHNTGFRVLGLPHTYSLFETAEVDESVKKLLRSPDFGGASVTIPHKISIIPLLDELTEEAKVIGAVNTIIAEVGPDGRRKLRGDNTDWKGIRDCVLARLPSIPVSSFSGAIGNGIGGGKEKIGKGKETRGPAAGLVIGAGGTARAAIYALYSIGTKTIYLYNRTRASAEALKRSFESVLKEVEIVIVDDVDVGKFRVGLLGEAPSVVISTVPGSATSVVDRSKSEKWSWLNWWGATTTTTTAGKGDAGVVLTKEMFCAKGGGVVVDMAYKPAETPLLTLAASVSSSPNSQDKTEETGESEGSEGEWRTVRGVDVLLEQGYAQFEMWTGRRCPKEEVRKKVWEYYNNSGSEGLGAQAVIQSTCTSTKSLCLSMIAGVGASVAVIASVGLLKGVKLR